MLVPLNFNIDKRTSLIDILWGKILNSRYGKYKVMLLYADFCASTFITFVKFTKIYYARDVNIETIPLVAHQCVEVFALKNFIFRHNSCLIETFC